MALSTAWAATSSCCSLATALLALSNGLLATASMMQVARLAPEGLREEGVYVAVAGVYFGLAAGATVSWAGWRWRVGRAIFMQLPSCRSRVGVSVRLCSPLFSRYTHTLDT